MFLPEKFPQKGITACTEKGMRGRLHSLFLLRAPHAVASGSFSDDIPAHAFPCGLSSGGNVRLWLSCFKIGSTANFPYVFQEFHRSETKVSHRGNFCFPLLKLLFPQWETDSLHIYASPPPLMVVAGGKDCVGSGCTFCEWTKVPNLYLSLCFPAIVILICGQQYAFFFF